ncbi:hypothetical protein GGR53DRAFT_213611 [Hypoxylon sp. FL1150]|nr:hypothetical protein GGR53DRAFT_213611 [Hypoxylon sp. FL1150]
MKRAFGAGGMGNMSIVADMFPLSWMAWLAVLSPIERATLRIPTRLCLLGLLGPTIPPVFSARRKGGVVTIMVCYPGLCLSSVCVLAESDMNIFISVCVLSLVSCCFVSALVLHRPLCDSLGCDHPYSQGSPLGQFASRLLLVPYYILWLC